MSDTLRAYPNVFPWVSFLIGLVVGSFLNVVIHRLPKMMERASKEECAELENAPQTKMHVYEVRSHKDKRGVDLISDALWFGRRSP